MVTQIPPIFVAFQRKKHEQQVLDEEMTFKMPFPSHAKAAENLQLPNR